MKPHASCQSWMAGGAGALDNKSSENLRYEPIEFVAGHGLCSGVEMLSHGAVLDVIGSRFLASFSLNSPLSSLSQAPFS